MKIFRATNVKKNEQNEQEIREERNENLGKTREYTRKGGKKEKRSDLKKGMITNKGKKG